MSNSLALRRRTFLNFGLLGAAVSAALPVKAFPVFDTKITGSPECFRL